MDEHAQWRELAFAMYRLARAELDSIAPGRRDELNYWIVELREALLDLKEAVAADDPVRAMRSMDEVNVLLTEMWRRQKGD